MIQIICRGCKTQFSHHARGRPPVLCQKCKLEGTPVPPDRTDEDIIEAAFARSTANTVVSRRPLVANVEEDSSLKLQSKAGYYRVIVSNLGVAHACDNEKEARIVYDKYVQKSTAGYGQVGNEKVELVFGSEVLLEYVPRLD